MTDFTSKTLGQYEVREVLGKGGMATVYLGFQPSTSRPVAIKVLPPQFTHDETFIKRFQQEAKVIAQLEHQSILPIYDFGQEGDTPYIVMRYVDGGTLDDRIRAGDLSLSEMQRFISQVGSALDYAHQKNVIHRDLKPRNILIDGQGNAYLSDFGIAKLTENTMDLTGTGVMGTPAYIAPEVARGHKHDPRADVYALGVVAYEMLTGKIPYEADTPMGVLYKHINEPVPSVQTIRPDLPPALDEVIQNVLTKKPEQRYQSAVAFAQAFADAMQVVERGDDDHTIPLTVEETKPPSRTPAEARAASPASSGPAEKKKRRLPIAVLILGAVGIVVACLCAGVFIASANQPAGACRDGPHIASAPEAGDATVQTLILPDSNQLYIEDFSSEKAEWTFANASNPSGFWTGSELCLSHGRRGSGRILTSLTSQTLADFSVEVDTVLLGAESADASVLVRYRDESNYLAFIVTRESYAIQHVTDGQSRQLVPPTPAGAIRPPGETNHLRVEAAGPIFSFYVNGAYLTTVSVPDADPAGHIGLAVDGTGENGASFDNLTVNSLKVLPLEEFAQEVLPIEQTGYVWQAESGQIIGTVQDTDTVVWVPAGIEVPDIVVDVDVEALTSDPESSFGLLCRLVDVNNFYEVLIDNNGLYSVWLLHENEWTALVDWTDTSAINANEGAINHLRVACVEDTILVSVNGQVVDSVQDSTHPAGDVALVIENGPQPGTRVTFDNFVGFSK